MSDMLQIGASGVRAYQTALATVSDNIANSGVAGYARRSTDLQEIAPATGGFSTGRVLTGNGALATGISRIADQFQAASVRTASADLAKSETGATWLGDVQSALTGYDLGDRLTSFFDAGTTLAADPTSSAARSSMLEAGTSVAQAFTGSGQALDTVDADIDTSATQATQQLTALASSIAGINDGLSRVGAGTAAAANLSDQRDQLLEQMSAIADISVSTDSLGRATVALGNAGGPTLVKGISAGAVTFSRNDDGAIGFAVHREGAVDAVTPTGGALAGLVEGAQRVADARTTLNGIAGDFASKVNAVQAQGRDLNGQAGAAMFTTGASPTDLTMALTDGSQIAAASVGGSTRDGSNLDALAAARTSAGTETRVSGLTAGVASTLEQRQTVVDAQTSIRDGAVAARDSTSGVSLDQEAVDLMRFQQAYSASSRVIQVARDTFQSILDIR